MKRRLYCKPIGPWPLPIGPVQPVAFVPLDRKDDAEAITRARDLLANGERVVFDCEWPGPYFGSKALLGFEVVRRRDRFVVLIGGGYAGDHATLEDAVRVAFLTDGDLE